MSRLGSETAFEVLAAARVREALGHRVIHLEIGEPDFPTPPHIVEAGIRALRDGATGYTPAVGILELREAIAEQVAETRGITVHPDEVVVTPGGKPVMFYSLLAVAGEGDEVIYPDPGFPIYDSMIRFVGATPVPIPLREEIDFRLDVEELLGLIGPRTKLIILNSPCNPTGSVLTRSDMARIAQACVNRNLMVLSDEIYSRILYDEEHVSIASFPGMQDKTIILDGFSKTYAMTGWRLGYGVMNRELAHHFGKLMINSNSCTAAFTQFAGIEALRGDQGPTEEMIATFRRRRDRVVPLLNAIEGVSCRTPRGAFYAFPNISSSGLSAKAFQVKLLEEENVAVLSGPSFGPHGEGYLRLSYASSIENLEQGIERIGHIVRSLG